MRKIAPHEGELPREAVEAASLETQSSHGASRWNTYRRCQREHALRYRDGIVPKDRLFDRLDYFSLGSTMHAILTYMWRGFAVGDNDRSWRDALLACTQRPGGLDEDVFLEAERLAGAYYARWGAPDFAEGFEYVASEVLLEDGVTCPMCDGAKLDGNGNWCRTCYVSYSEGSAGFVDGSFAQPYTARLDLIGRVAGELVIVDTKTRKAKIPDNRMMFSREAAVNPQFLGQAHLVMRAYGLTEPPGVLVNAIIKTKVPGFDRVLARPTLEDVERWRENHAREAEAGLDGDLMNYSSCAPPMGSRCGYFNWCHGSAEMRERNFVTMKGQST